MPYEVFAVFATKDEASSFVRALEDRLDVAVLPPVQPKPSKGFGQEQFIVVFVLPVAAMLTAEAIKTAVQALIESGYRVMDHEVRKKAESPPHPSSDDENHTSET